ncbi:MAG TPA: hypothetical protein VNM50_02120 [Chloroflexota bacterium]|nr:hypothetical protein [Chloroflexota bacterium]
MHPWWEGPATAKATRYQQEAAQLQGFDLRTARRLAFFRWLVDTGRLSDWNGPPPWAERREAPERPPAA